MINQIYTTEISVYKSIRAVSIYTLLHYFYVNLSRIQFWISLNCILEGLYEELISTVQQRNLMWLLFFKTTSTRKSKQWPEYINITDRHIIYRMWCCYHCVVGAFELASYVSPMHAVVYNPVEPRIIATANAKEGVGLWDIRRPKSWVLLFYVLFYYIGYYWQPVGHLFAVNWVW